MIQWYQRFVTNRHVLHCGKGSMIRLPKATNYYEPNNDLVESAMWHPALEIPSNAQNKP